MVRIPKEKPLVESRQLRPISLTNIIMRLFERLLYKDYIFSLVINDIVPENPSRDLSIRFADDMILSVSVKSNLPDPSLKEVEILLIGQRTMVWY